VVSVRVLVRVYLSAESHRQGRNRYSLYLWLPIVLTDRFVVTGNLARVPIVPMRKYHKYGRYESGMECQFNAWPGRNLLKLLFLRLFSSFAARLPLGDLDAVASSILFSLLASFPHVTHQPPNPHHTHHSHENHARWAPP